MSQTAPLKSVGKIITSESTAKEFEQKKIAEQMQLAEQEEKAASEGFDLFMKTHNVVMECISTESDVRGMLGRQINFISKRRLPTQ